MLRFHHLAWHNLSLKYGPIVGAKLGGKRVILVSGKELIRDVCNNEAFDGRPDGFFFRVRSFNEKLGVVFVEGEYWQEQRRFSLRTLKHLGLGRNSMAISIEKEALEMVNFLKIKSKLGLIEMDKLFDISVLNLIWTLLAGQRFELDDERLSILTEMIHKSFRIADMSGGLLNLFPWLRFIMPEKSGYLPLLNSLKPLWKFLGDAIDTIRDRPEDEETRCFIQAFLNEMKNNQNPQRYTDKQLFVLCLDLFQAGSETTSNTLSFGIIYMLKNPEIQNKIRNELDKTIGFDRQPLLSDRPYLQYTDAVLSEIMRFATVAPLAIAHRSLEKIKLDKYVIPKDTTILLSLYSLHFDEKYWIDPHVFRPERFLDKNGQILQHDGWYLPFGFGKLNYLRFVTNVT